MPTWEIVHSRIWKCQIPFPSRTFTVLTFDPRGNGNQRPFIYFPLRHHFEQNFHVHHRLQRYRAGRRLDFNRSPPEAIAKAIAHEIGRDVDYRPVEPDGAVPAAAMIAQLL